MIYLATQKGVNKTESEDAILIGNQVICDTVGEFAMPQTGFVCIADGVGGNRGGRFASHYVLTALSETIPEREELRKTVLQINGDMLKVSETNRELSGMATTLSGIYLSGDTTTLFHVGNTRIYAKQGNYLKQLTADHTVYNWLIDLGRFEEAEKCQKNEIISCLGGGSPKFVERLSVFDLSHYSTLLFTTDGVHDHVTIDLLEELVSSGKDGTKICEEIIAAAMETGSKDDISVMLLMEEEEDNGIPI